MPENGSYGNHGRRFIAPNGRTTTQPLRPPPDTPDPPDVLDARRDALNIRDEPECVSRAIVEPMTELARTYDRARHHRQVEARQQIRALLTPHQRLVNARRMARLQRVDITSQIHVIGCKLERAQRAGRSIAPVLKQIEQVEARLDHRPDLEP